MAALYPVPVAGPGRLSLMACPEAGGFDALRRQGVTHVVSLLPQDQATALGMTAEDTLCDQAGLRFLNFPIVDFGVPDADDCAALVQEICAKLAQGRHVAVHCRAGIGRSGLVAACVLIAQGQPVDAVLDTVTKARGIAVPETDAQRAFVVAFAARM